MIVALSLGMSPGDVRACTPRELAVVRGIYLERKRRLEDATQPEE